VRVLSIDSSDGLTRVIARRRRARRVALAIPSVDPTELAGWEARINRHYGACGCSTGAVTVLATGIVLAILGVRYADMIVRHPLLASSVGLMALMASAGAGKTVGLLVSRVRLKAVVAALRRRLAEQPPPAAV
jgi:hypothetical protein